MAAGKVFDAVIRVSRRNGRDGDSFMSPDEQREAIERRAAADGVTIAEWFDETDSVSGGSVEREGLQAAIKRSVAGKVRGIYVAKIDRFARTVQGGLSVINTLEDAGAELRSAREGVIVGNAKATATDVLVRTFWLMLAQWQRDTLTEGWEEVRERHIDNGIAAHDTYGYVKDAVYGPSGKLVSGTRKLVAHPDEAAWVVRIFKRRANGASWNALVDWLNSEPDATPRKGRGWSPTTVRSMIMNRVYLGEVRSGEFVNENAHDPIVPRALWERANNRNGTTTKRDKGRRAPEQYLLSGLVRCAGCGARLMGRSDVKTNAAGDEVTYRYYRCRGRVGADKCGARAQVKADDVEQYAERLFRERFLNRTAVPSESTDELDAATAALTVAEDDLREFLTSPATDELRELGQSWVEEGQRARIARVRDARERVAQARNKALGVALPTDLADLWDTLSVPEKREFLAIGLEVVAAAKGGAVRVWTRNDPAAPQNLPGVEHPGVGVTPILGVNDVPDGTGVTAGK